MFKKQQHPRAMKARNERRDLWACTFYDKYYKNRTYLFAEHSLSLALMKFFRK